MPKPPKHILVIRLSAMGDVAMTVPVLRAFIVQHPNINLTILTRSFFKPFFRNLKNVTVYEVDVKEKHKGIFGLYKLYKEIRPLEINAIADLHNVLRSKILKFFFFGIKSVQIDKGRVDKKTLVSGKKFQQLKTTHQRYADVFDKLGYKLDLTNPTFPKRSNLNDKTLGIVGRHKLKQIGIAPFAAHEGKMYPIDLMKEVIAILSKKYKVILFGGGKQEIDLLNTVENKYQNVINLAGKLTLGEELDVISNLDLILSMDSGNGHVAAMLGIKVITIWGVTHPFAGFAPFNQPLGNALLANRDIYPKTPTSIYGNKYPEEYKEASRSISPKTIIEKIESII